MKQSTRKIIEKFPVLEDYLNANDNVLLKGEALSDLHEVQQVFLHLAWFFENPESENFYLGSIYHYLVDDWIEFALEVIDDFFKNDTYLIKKKTTSFVTKKDVYLSQSQFANFLNENAVPFSRQKVNIYLNRNKFPDPDLIVGGMKYWNKEIAKQFLKDQKKTG